MDSINDENELNLLIALAIFKIVLKETFINVEGIKLALLFLLNEFSENKQTFQTSSF